MITKRQLGMGIIALGLGGDLALLILGRLGAGAWGGIGPFERTLLLAGFLAALTGVPLLRLGNVPAAEQKEPRYQAAPFFSVAGNQTAQVWVARVLMALAILAFLAYLGVYVAYAVDLFRWPYDYDQGESFELYDSVLHSQGEWPYRDGQSYPFYSSNYPPFFHILTMLLFPILGKRLLAGRLLAFVITLLTAALIGWTVHRRTGEVFVPILCALGYTASNFVYHVGPLCRQQLTMVFLETLAVFFIADSDD
ncbi:MAG: hypothetical protein JW981_01100, partial [Anaerolineae bacterium]|nr:hypothetical protein [Anaerolineae bacterium]